MNCVNTDMSDIELYRITHIIKILQFHRIYYERCIYYMILILTGISFYLSSA